MTKDEIIAKVNEAFQKHLAGGLGDKTSLISADPVAGKLYEAFVLSQVAGELAASKQFELKLSAGTKLFLKGSPGPINASFPHIQIWKGGLHCASMWTDVEFTALSCHMDGKIACDPGHFHELDIVIAETSATGRPTPEQIWLGVECKHRNYGKSFLREALGVRRELSLLTRDQVTKFSVWPRRTVPANPPVCLMVYSSSPTVLDYSAPGKRFGIDFTYLPMV